MSDYKILPYTPHSRMVFRAIIRKAASWYEDIAAANDMPTAYMDELITDYAMMCARVSGLNGQVDFQLARMEDTPEEVRAKFEVYLNSKNMAEIRAVEQEMIRMDMPADSILAPGAKPEGEA